MRFQAVPGGPTQAVLGRRFQAGSSRRVVPGRWFQAGSSRSAVPGRRLQAGGPRQEDMIEKSEPPAWNHLPGTARLGPRAELQGLNFRG